MAIDSADQQHDQLFDALAGFEAAVETPCVPGELERWIDAVDVSFERLRPRVKERIERVHPQQFAEIGSEDAELFRRVDRLRLEDGALRDLIQHVGDQISKLKTAAANIEPDEAKLRDAVNAFIQEAIDFVIRMRTQTHAVRTWLMESLTRDRGAVD